MKQLFALMAILGLTFAQIGCGETATEEPKPETPAASTGDAAPADGAAEEKPADDAGAEEKSDAE